jgi:hypothetical protein
MGGVMASPLSRQEASGRRRRRWRRQDRDRKERQICILFDNMVFLVVVVFLKDALGEC